MSDKAEWIAAISTGVAALSTIAYTVISIGLWKETRKQAKATQEQLELTARQMNLAESAYRAATQPVFGIDVSIDVPEDGTLSSRDLRLVFRITNYGQTPILDLKTGLSDSHYAFSKDIYWGHVLPRQTATAQAIVEISKEVATSWLEQLDAHNGQLNFVISTFSFMPSDGDQKSALFSNSISADLEGNVEGTLRYLAL